MSNYNLLRVEIPKTWHNGSHKTEPSNRDEFCSRIAAYLPSNYWVAFVDYKENCIYIQGNDSAGWTADGYVIPRLASGLIFAKKVDLSAEGLTDAAHRKIVWIEGIESEYSGAEETAAILADPETMAAIEEGMADLDAGRTSN